MIEDKRPLLRVVAGVVLNEQGEYLLSSRPEGKPYAGYWEFAGGKVEAEEGELEALKREFEEELGICIHHATPWLTMIHAYEHARVHLRFYRVAASDWSGQLQAREGQSWSWQRAGDYTVAPMLPANTALLKSLAIPLELSGSLKSGFEGENAIGNYRVVPFLLAEPTHPNVLISLSELKRLGKLPAADSVWIIVEKPADYQQAADADVLVWHTQNTDDAEQVLMILHEGVSVPLVLLAPQSLCDLYREHWLQAGAQAVVIDTAIELA